MVDKKSSIIRDRDRELLLPVSNPTNDEQSSPKPSSSFSHHAGREVDLQMGFGLFEGKIES
ncbi:hypothetical protein HanLR1_Chr12g0430171 [Helianthus annuus]|nr:hypothetical protein HanLR1_Chr12g0430171 [Helianthus annuus]